MSKATVIPFGPQHPVLPEPLHLDLVVAGRDRRGRAPADRVRAPRPGEARGNPRLQPVHLHCRAHLRHLRHGTLPRLCRDRRVTHGRGGAQARRVFARHLARAVPYPLASVVAGPCRRRLRLRVDVHALLAFARARARPVREDHRGTGHPVRGEGGRRGARHRREPDGRDRLGARRYQGRVHADHEYAAHGHLGEEPHRGRGPHHHRGRGWRFPWWGLSPALPTCHYDVRSFGRGAYGDLADFAAHHWPPRATATPA